MNKITQEDIAAGSAIITRLNAAVMAGNGAEAEKIAAEVQPLLGRLNNGEMGTYAHPEAVGYQLQEATKAEDGAVPVWGQAGRFVIVVDGIKCLVEYGGIFALMGTIGGSFKFYALDMYAPFFSETGFRSHIINSYGVAGVTVEEAAKELYRINRKGVDTFIKPTAHLDEKMEEFNRLPFVQSLGAIERPRTGAALQMSLF